MTFNWNTKADKIVSDRELPNDNDYDDDDDNGKRGK